MEYSITQNTVYLTVASVLQKIISFGYFTLVARIIGVEGTGQYFFAIAFTSIFTVVADFGLSPVLTRELAKNQPEPSGAINTVFTTKLVFSVLTYLLLVAAIWLLGYAAPLRMLVYICGFTMFFDNVQTVFYSIFRSHGNLRYESRMIVMSQFITMLIGSVALFVRAPLVFLIWAYTIPSALLSLYGFYAVYKKYGHRIRLRINARLLGQWLAWSWPFAMAAILSRLYAYTDSIIISKFLPAEHLGWWSVPYKITFAFQFIAVAVSTSLYPAVSAAVGDSERIKKNFIEAWQYLFVVSLPLAFGLAAVAKPVITRLYGLSYQPSVIVLQILLMSLIFGFLSFITGAVLNATNRQRWQTILMGAALVVNCAGNLLLLPRLGLTGAAVAALIGNVILAVGGYFACNSFLKVPHGIIVRSLIKTLVPALLMGFAAFKLTAVLPLLAVIPISACIYAILAFYSGALSTGLLQSLRARLSPQSRA